MITKKDIILDGHPTLRMIAQEVELPPSPEDQAILKSMHEYLLNSQDDKIAEKYGLRPGVGLAAPQINVSKRMIAVHVTDEKDKLYSYALFNPKIISHSVQQAYLTYGEGCLSIEESIPGYVVRSERVTVSGFDIDGNKVKIRLKGMPAIVFQHEIDHLNGVLFYDHIDMKDPFKKIEGATPIGR